MREMCGSRVIQTLTALREHVLMNPDINKTVKVDVFSVGVVQHIINILKWERSQLMKKIDENLVLEEEKKVRHTALEFLITLCSSVEHGILTEVGGLKWQSSEANASVYRIISSVHRPWDTAEGNHLLSQVFASAPELFLRYLESLGYLLHPRPSASFVSLMGMLVMIVKMQKPWQWAIDRGWEGVMLSLFPSSHLHQKFYLDLVLSDSSTVRYAGLTLMLAIVKKAKETFENLQGLRVSLISKDKGKEELIKTVHNIFTEQLVNILVDNWVGVLNHAVSNSGSSLEGSDELYVPPAMELLCIAEFLWYYSELLPSSVKEMINPITVFKTVQFVKNWEAKELESNTCIRAEFWSALCNILAVSINRGRFIMNDDLDENLFHVLIQTYACCQDNRGNTPSPSDSKGICYKLTEVLTLALNRVGISDDCDGIKYWLKYVTGDGYLKTGVFFTHVIQQTLSSYSKYTDDLIEIRERFGSDENCCLSIDISAIDYKKSRKFIVQGFNKPFSRFVLAAVDLLSANPDKACLDYFSCVVEDYLYAIYNPGLLISFLLDKDSILNDSLREYLSCFVKHPEMLMEGESSDLGNENLTLSKLLKLSFMAQDLAPLDALLQFENLADLLENDTCTLALQVFMYIHVEPKNDNPESTAFVEKYAAVLKKVYATLREEDKAQSAASLVKTVLEHPTVMVSFRPFSLSPCPLSHLCSYFIAAALTDHHEIASCTYPYYSRIMSDLKSVSMVQAGQLDLWNFTQPFVTYETSPLSYKDLEELFCTCLQLPCPLSPSHGPFLLKILQFLLKVTTAKRQPQEETIQLTLNKHIEWIALHAKKDPSLKELIQASEDFLSKVMSAEVAKQITQGKHYLNIFHENNHIVITGVQPTAI